MKFKRQELTRTRCKNNLLKIWEQCTEEDKFDWYSDANSWADLMSQNRDITVSHVCGVIAALSPLKTWQQNLKLSAKMIQTRKSVGHTRLCNKKALYVLKSDGSDESILEILKGNKISAFYLNIKYPKNGKYLTIDRHALSCLLGYWVTDDDYRGITKSQYEFFVQVFQWTAQSLNVNPLLLQSSTWVRWRKIKQNYKK